MSTTTTNATATWTSLAYTANLRAAYVSCGKPVRRLGVGQKQLVEILRAVDKRSRILVLDDGERVMNPGDVVVQLGNWHGWSNESSASLMAFIMMGGSRS